MEDNLDRALDVFGKVCSALDSHGWHYEKKEEELVVECGAQGEDLPMEITVAVNPKNQIVSLISHLPFAISEEKRLEVAIAISAVNNNLVDGCFDFDIKSGHIFFRMTNSFIGSDLSEEMLFFMIIISCKTIDDYNDKFLMLSKGTMKVDDFINNN